MESRPTLERVDVRNVIAARPDPNEPEGGESAEHPVDRLSRRSAEVRKLTLREGPAQDHVVAARRSVFAGEPGEPPRDPYRGGIQHRLVQGSGGPLEPFREQIIRGGVIPTSASRGFACHHGRTVLLERLHFETWIATDVKNWTEASTSELCRNWLIQEMIASPNNKKKRKTAWFEQANNKYHLSRREFDCAWFDACHKTQSKWGQPGAPYKSSH